MEVETDASRQLLLSAYFFASVAYAVLIPESWQLAERLGTGNSAAWSGALIGSYYASSLFGMAAFHCLRRLGWSYKALFVYPCFGRVLSDISFVLALQASAVSPTLLLASRLLEGALNSCQFMCAIQFLTITARDRVTLSGYTSLLTNVGIGFGMLLSGAIGKGASLQQNHSLEHALPVIFMGAFWAAFASVSACVMTKEDPNPQEETSAFVSKQQLVQTGRDLPGVRRSVILAALVFGVCRGFVGSGIDSASILVLETQFGWPKSSAAMAVGCCYVTSILWHVVFMCCRWYGLAADSLLVHCGIGICTLATLGIFDVSEHEGSNVALLLLADGIIFPVFMLTSGMVAAMSTRTCLLDDSFFSLPWVLFLQKSCTETLGLGLGPMTARSVLKSFGRDKYAGMQLFCIMAVAVAWATIINPGYAQLAANAKENDKATA
eukprot:TRINITY_DN62691_c0_g1_i1.p1 TRINITY_DN62691_c0_g1~~TRINITY_DN62691_c0_g1_i1.p1  ORF type:complete len:437 (+),score=68.72 TRINITY_DN62691_c0_g1_i1:40-1350(+)